MDRNDCVLAATGTTSPAGTILLIAAVLLIGTGLVILAVRGRRGGRAAIAALALVVLVGGAVAVPSGAAMASTGAEHCVDDPKSKPKPKPAERTPDLTAAAVGPAEALAAGEHSAVVFTLRNGGRAATSGPIEARLALSADAPFSLDFDDAATEVTIDGDDRAVSNGEFSAVGSGSQEDPFLVTTAAILAPGETIAIGVGLTVLDGGAGAGASATIDIVGGTGGGETPTTNNSAAVSFSAAEAPVEERHPDLVPEVAAPQQPIEPEGGADLVFVLKNAGAAATSGPIESRVALPADAPFALRFDGAQTSATVDGVDRAVANTDFSVSGSGTAADPFVVTTQRVLQPGGDVAFALRVDTTPDGAGATTEVSIDVTGGTGGGEAPVDNNTASATIRAAEEPEGCTAVNDKSHDGDTDGDGTVDACDLDSDNDGILDSEEDFDRNGLFRSDDADGNILITPVLGDGVPNYLDLDSENDSVLDLMEGRPLSHAEIDLYDADRNGVFDAGLSFGTNGLLDALETSPDSGQLRADLVQLRNLDGDSTPDALDPTSNGNDNDMYAVGNDALDLLGGGFLSVTTDADRDGIQDPADTDLITRGAPNSPYSPYSE